jgi:hypothetical protein
VRDRVGDADPRQPWWGSRVGEKADEGEAAREQQRAADERERGRAPLVEPEQDGGRDGEMKRQVSGGEQASQAGEHVDGALQLDLEEEVQRALCRREAKRVSPGFGGVADDEAARELVQAVEGEHDRRLGVQWVPHHSQRPGGPLARAAIEAAAEVVMRCCRAHRLRHVVRLRRVAGAAARATVLSPRRLRDRVRVAEVPEARASAPGSAARAARAQLVPRVAPTGWPAPR